jgi:endonuclease/exonuclease/phosphatase family metal-dependent hydrolase
VIALQEVERFWRDQDFPDQAARLGELLPGYDWVYGAAVSLRGDTPARRRQIGNMILSRWPVSSTRTLPLPARPVFGHMNDEQAMTEAVVLCPSTPLRIYNTHLNYLDADQRLDQIGRLMTFIAEAPDRGGPVTSPGKPAPGPEDAWIVLPGGELPPMPRPAILMGDFNLSPDSREYAVLASRLADAMAGQPDFDTITFPGGGPEPPQRLDYIFLTQETKDRVTRTWVDASADGSDHQPVWLELHTA